MDDLKLFVYNWNYEYPIDRWYRNRYEIPFNSSKHRDSCFIDMAFEFIEDKIYADLKDKKGEFAEKEEYIVGSSIFKKFQKEVKAGDGEQEHIDTLTQKEFDNLDLSQFKKE